MVRGLPFGTACDKKTSSANKCEPVCKTCCKSFICVDAFVGKSVVQPHPSPENLSFAVNWTAFSRLLTLQKAQTFSIGGEGWTQPSQSLHDWRADTLAFQLLRQLQSGYSPRVDRWSRGNVPTCRWTGWRSSSSLRRTPNMSTLNCNVTCLLCLFLFFYFKYNF